METKVVILDELNIDYTSLRGPGQAIRDGGLVVFPTETVYGLGADALNNEAVAKIFKAKGRPQDNPLIVHVGSREIGPYVKDVPEIATLLMNRFWPGALTLIFNKSELIPDITCAGLDTVGIRMPSNPIALDLIRVSNTPIAAPSANISGRPSPTDVSRCIQDLSGRVDYIIGGKRSDVGLESTILDCTQNPPCVLRPGGVSIEDLKEIDERIYIDPAIMTRPHESFKPKAPGMKYRHYAPKAPVKIVQLHSLASTINRINELTEQYEDDGIKVGIMATDETKEQYQATSVISLGSREDLSSVAKNLFEALRILDDLGVDLILSESFIEKGFGLAIMNRLRKAASYDIIDQ
ncbi:L-threonylcarbamoyladenylate synthase [Haloplasma contractile]|uniref:Threonylcarbamoyl-AMP synthase n=1 Tax=Haloplasma contractile SSD-17B TaxID=1033810 RepID=F7PVE4_9MOLU|nr:L-threonylcarbamoyladenylate synthase [Haloplasma contractile]ERJ12891.1 UDP-3-O-3-hydroxymyristoyl glucosamine N-acyltransferase protein [Haloplasma contractile SSD-17B]